MYKNTFIIVALFSIIFLTGWRFQKSDHATIYSALYSERIRTFIGKQEKLINLVLVTTLDSAGKEKIAKEIYATRQHLKSVDFWLRYLDPVLYKKINGPLSVEWETEVFEKFEKPYKREGAGLTLAFLYLKEEQKVERDSLLSLLYASANASAIYLHDSITNRLNEPDHFFFCNRLFLLNLAAIYTTGFECPDSDRIIPELEAMLTSVGSIYLHYNQAFTATPIGAEYFKLYENALHFIKNQNEYESFDHFNFIKDYINPLFGLNQRLIKNYNAKSVSYVDYSLNAGCSSIFSKNLYNSQNAKGIYLRIYDKTALAEIERVGKLLFYDPILSGNNQRSCASCHNPVGWFTDTNTSTHPQFNKRDFLARNSPSLINAGFNHLLMLDGKHLSLQEQARAVIVNAAEMNCNTDLALQKVLSCKEYKNTFKQLLKYTPEQKEVNIDHIISAITMYYSTFSRYYAPFDEYINGNGQAPPEVKKGFNLFMGKAQCATCHFVPQFNGVKPPYVGSEFEVLGVPEDTLYSRLSDDKGRHVINAAKETLNAFRTGTVRNSARTKPYMHNGVFNTMNQVIEFYNRGGGSGHGLFVENQTLSGDSLGLTSTEKKDLIIFIKSLNESIPTETKPKALPLSKNKKLNTRKTGGDY